MSRPLRVAHVVCSTGATGVESYLIALLPAFDRAEVEPVLFCPGPGIMVDRLRDLNVPVEFGAPMAKLDLAAEWRLARRWAGAFDLVHAHGPRSVFWTHRAAGRAGIPFLATVHELRWQTVQPSLKREMWIALEAHAMRRASRLITVSDATRRDLIERFPELAARTSTVHASAPMLLAADRLPRARPAERGDGPLRLVTVGRFSWQKGFDLLLPAMAELKRRDVRFVLDIVGFGVEEQDHRSMAARLGVGDSVRWLGRDLDLPRLLADSHVFVTATRSEMFGIAVLEAMAIGLPVLAPAVGSLLEVVAEGETGTLVPFDPEASLPSRMAAVLTRWDADPAERARLGDNGWRRAREVFGPASLGRGVTEVYRRMLAGTPPRA